MKNMDENQGKGGGGGSKGFYKPAVAIKNWI